MSHDYQPKQDAKIYICPKCGAAYTHDAANAHAVYFCPKRETRHA